MVGVYGLDSHIESHIEISFFCYLRILRKIFVLFYHFFVDLFAIFELITILSVSYGNQVLLMTHSRDI